MRRLLPPVLAVFAAAGLLVFQMRRMSPAGQVGEVAHGIRCGSCNTNYTMTTAEMNRMISRGEVVSPPEQLRRFKCAGCGKLEATLDFSAYEHLRSLKEEQP